MISLIEESVTQHTPESLAATLSGEPGVILLRSELLDGASGRYSFVTARPFLSFRAFGAHCDVRGPLGVVCQFGDPWQILDRWLSRFEILDEVDLPFPLGGCFGYWGFGLKVFVEPGLPQRAVDDLSLPDCCVGFYSSLVAFDHQLGRTWIISTGMSPDGARDEAAARAESAFWRSRLETGASARPALSEWPIRVQRSPSLRTSLNRAEFISAVRRAQRYIRAGDIYQVNLARRFSVRSSLGGWELYQRLAAVSPAPFAAYMDCGDFQIASSSPELFLRLSGLRITTRPIKGTRPRSPDPTRDAQLAYELQTSPKELAELMMITDLLRNDLGKICEYGSVQTPELVRLERFAHVQHLVSTVEGRLRPGATHVGALASCFPGGSITGAPKIRALEIIDELEPVTRGPYTGALGYLGFNRESQLSILIRAAICRGGIAHFHSGAGIVADSLAEAECQETVDKARGFFEALDRDCPASERTLKSEALRPFQEDR